jgi:hypothetical protein
MLHRNVLSVVLLLAGCGGGDFTAGAGPETVGGDPDGTGGAVEADAGAAGAIQGTGGVTGVTGGQPAVTGGSVGTGGNFGGAALAGRVAQRQGASRRPREALLGALGPAAPERSAIPPG